MRTIVWVLSLLIPTYASASESDSCLKAAEVVSESLNQHVL